MLPPTGDNNIISFTAEGHDDIATSDPLELVHPPTGLSAQDPPGLLKLLGSSASGPPLMNANPGLSSTQAGSPLIIHQSPGLAKVPLTAPCAIGEMADKHPTQTATDKAPITPQEGSVEMDNESVSTDTLEAPVEAEPPNFPKICVALTVPGWEPSASAGNFLNAHKNFIGIDPSTLARPDGPPHRGGLRRSASVSFKPHVNK